MQVSLINQNGEALNSIELEDAVFNIPMNPSLVHQAMVIYQGNKRQGTHDTKTRAQVSGGGRKPWIQKHTGRARQGSTRAPQWRHGGVVFGPHPRSYRATLPRRMRRQALRCVLSDKVRQGRLFCVDSTSTIDGKTKSMSVLLDNLSISGSALIVTMGTDRNVVLAANNIKKIRTLPVNQLNAQELLSRDIVIMTVEAAKWIEGTLANDPHGRRGSKWGDLVGVPNHSEPAPASGTEEGEPKPRRRRTTANKSESGAPAQRTVKPRTRRSRAASAVIQDETAEVPEAPPESQGEEV